MYHGLLWELPKQSWVGKASARASTASGCCWPGLPSPITSTARKARCSPALSGVAAVEMMCGLIRPASLGSVRNYRAFECDA